MLEAVIIWLNQFEIQERSSLIDNLRVTEFTFREFICIILCCWDIRDAYFSTEAFTETPSSLAAENSYGERGAYVPGLNQLLGFLKFSSSNKIQMWIVSLTLSYFSTTEYYRLWAFLHYSAVSDVSCCNFRYIKTAVKF